MVDQNDRRIFLRRAGLFVASACLSQSPLWAAEQEEEEVSPVEDLMREHGILNRLLLIYDYASGILVTKQDLSLKPLGEAREIIRSFIESYHEKLEEEHVFPQFEKAKKFTDLVAVLRKQHIAGREVTAELGKALQRGERSAIVPLLKAFTRMYRPHEAREDTVLFPAFKSLISKKQYETLGDQFEDLEHKLFGKAGFNGIVDKVASIEKQFSLYDLQQFTPKV
jgi:hemerythrin-like domain-containing protein